jgi:uncharacterized protein GlcG (DUF336 family)
MILALTLFIDNECIGAIGVAGGTVEQDSEIAKLSIQKFMEK